VPKLSTLTADRVEEFVRARFDATTIAQAQKRILPVLAAAKKDLDARIKAATQAGNVFTAQQAQAYREQLTQAMVKLGKAMAPAVTGAMVTAAEDGLHTVATVLSMVGTSGGVAPVPFTQLARLTGAFGHDSSLLQEFYDRGNASALNYGIGMIGQFETLLANGLAQGKSTDKMSDAILSSNAGFGGAWWRAERIARTETSFAFNTAAREGVTELQDDYPDTLLRWVEHVTDDSRQPMDDRVGADSLRLHGQLRLPGHLFNDPVNKREVREPPNRPNDRAALVMWRASWGEPPGGLAALDDESRASFDEALKRLAAAKAGKAKAKNDAEDAKAFKAQDDRLATESERAARESAQADAEAKAAAAARAAAEQAAQAAQEAARAAAEAASLAAAQAAEAAAREAAKQAAIQSQFSTAADVAGDISDVIDQLAALGYQFDVNAAKDAAWDKVLVAKANATAAAVPKGTKLTAAQIASVDAAIKAGIQASDVLAETLGPVATELKLSIEADLSAWVDVNLMPGLNAAKSSADNATGIKYLSKNQKALLKSITSSIEDGSFGANLKAEAKQAVYSWGQGVDDIKAYQSLTGDMKDLLEQKAQGTITTLKTLTDKASANAAQSAANKAAKKTQGPLPPPTPPTLPAQPVPPAPPPLPVIEAHLQDAAAAISGMGHAELDVVVSNGWHTVVPDYDAKLATFKSAFDVFSAYKEWVENVAPGAGSTAAAKLVAKILSEAGLPAGTQFRDWTMPVKQALAKAAKESSDAIAAAVASRAAEPSFVSFTANRPKALKRLPLPTLGEYVQHPDRAYNLEGTFSFQYTDPKPEEYEAIHKAYTEAVSGVTSAAPLVRRELDDAIRYFTGSTSNCEWARDPSKKAGQAGYEEAARCNRIIQALSERKRGSVKPTFRGIGFKKNIADRLQVGRVFDGGSGQSWSFSELTASGFAGTSHGDRVAVVLRWYGSDEGSDISKLSVFPSESEVLIGGKFRITSREEKNGRVYLTVERAP